MILLSSQVISWDHNQLLYRSAHLLRAEHNYSSFISRLNQYYWERNVCLIIPILQMCGIKLNKYEHFSPLKHTIFLSYHYILAGNGLLIKYRPIIMGGLCY